MTKILDKLDLILKDRKNKDPKESYVSTLYQKGLDHTCDKINEESLELINALKKESKKKIISEATDLWFHTLVSLAIKNLTYHDILKELEKRFGKSGHIEKKNRGTN